MEDAPLQREMTTSTVVKILKAVDPGMGDLDLHPASTRSTYCCQDGESSPAPAREEGMTVGAAAWPNPTDYERDRVLAEREAASGDWQTSDSLLVVLLLSLAWTIVSRHETKAKSSEIQVEVFDRHLEMGVPDFCSFVATHHLPAGGCVRDMRTSDDPAPASCYPYGARSETC